MRCWAGEQVNCVVDSVQNNDLLDITCHHSGTKDLHTHIHTHTANYQQSSTVTNVVSLGYVLLILPLTLTREVMFHLELVCLFVC